MSLRRWPSASPSTQKAWFAHADLSPRTWTDHLGRSAVEAAKRWRFEPARVEDRPVASNMVVRFRFGADPLNY